MTPRATPRTAIWPGIAALLLASSGCVSPQPSEATGGYEVAYVIDGDTIDVTDPDGETHRVRLLGIDAPEVAHDDQPGECGAEAATDELRRLLPEGEPVQLLTDSRADTEDQYGRLLRYVQTSDGTDAAATVVEAGHAHAWTPDGEPTPDRADTYQAATDTARTAGTGSWTTCGDLTT